MSILENYSQKVKSLQHYRTLVIPFVSTTPIWDIFYYLTFWPLLWIMGVEQFLTPFISLWVFIKVLTIYKGRIRISTPIIWSALLVAWWGVPIFWVDSNKYPLFIKEFSTIISQLLILIVLMTIIDHKSWIRLVNLLEITASFCVVFGLLYVFGVLDFSFRSVFSNILPTSIIDSSNFFSQITYRELGLQESWVTFGRRAAPFAYGPSAYSSFLLFVFPFIWWSWRRASRLRKLQKSLLIAGIILSMFLTWTRTSIVIMVFQILILFLLSIKNKENRFVFSFSAILTAFLLLMASLFVGGYYLYQNLFNQLFISFRSGSWTVRIKIYQESLNLWLEHPFAGWGVPMEINNLSSIYSAGTHSTFIGMLFQHGIIGLIIYLGLLSSIFLIVLRLYKSALTPPAIDFSACAIAFIVAFVLRDVVAIWWWDQLVSFTAWIAFGLILTAPGHFNQQIKCNPVTNN